MIPVSRLDGKGTAYIECGVCGSADVTYERSDWTDETAGVNDRKRFLVEVVTCHAGQDCPDQKMDPLWRDAAHRAGVSAKWGAATPKRAEDLELAAAVEHNHDRHRRAHPFRGWRAKVAASLLAGPLDPHEIGARIGLPRSDVGSRANELCKAGWVEKLGRHTGAKKAKTLIYALTPDGRELAVQWANAQDRSAA